MSQRNLAMARKRKRKSRRKAKAKRKSVARRKPKRRVKRRAPRRSEADMLPKELRASRRRRSAQREGRIEREFQRAVNMTPASLSKWLKTRQSREVGWRRSERSNESIGHWSGRRIIEIKKKKPGDRTRADYSHMRKVTAYVNRHLAQRPQGNVRDTPWRYSLMNWGHDPLK
jgi:hypothetical protein